MTAPISGAEAPEAGNALQAENQPVEKEAPEVREAQEEAARTPEPGKGENVDEQA